MPKKIKLCERCGNYPAIVPDRNKPGRPINRICQRCHSIELGNDLKEIINNDNQTS